MTGKTTNLLLLSLGVMLALALWFSASAVVPQLEAEWGLGNAGQAWLTMSVQIGFVLGALGAALLGLADRVSNRSLVAAATLLGAIANAAIPVLDPSLGVTIGLRFLTGVAMAGVYPAGMRLAASWTSRDRGLGIGLLVGALTLGSSIPHLLNALPILGEAGMPPWRSVLLGASGLATIGAVIVWLGVREGPNLPKAGAFEWGIAGQSLRERSIRLANFGYLGHMWELYAVWAWVPIFLVEVYSEAGLSGRGARLAGFAMVAVGAIGCVTAGYWADRVGRVRVTVLSLLVSGACCLLAGSLASHPGLLTALCMIWGFAVIADSGQFSAAVSELSEPQWVGTALTVQTCLGFLLTMGTIHLVPVIRDSGGWTPALAFLSIGPVFGIVSMLKLRRLPAASRMASGQG